MDAVALYKLVMRPEAICIVLCYCLVSGTRFCREQRKRRRSTSMMATIVSPRTGREGESSIRGGGCSVALHSRDGEHDARQVHPESSSQKRLRRDSALLVRRIIL